MSPKCQRNIFLWLHINTAASSSRCVCVLRRGDLLTFVWQERENACVHDPFVNICTAFVLASVKDFVPFWKLHCVPCQREQRILIVAHCCVPVNWNCRGDEFLILPGASRLLFAAFILIRKGSCRISKESSLCQCKLRELLWIFHFTDIRTHSRRFMLERHAFLRLKRQKLISVGSTRVVAMKTRRQVLALRWVKYLFFLAQCLQL